MLTIDVDKMIRLKQLSLLDGEPLFALTEQNREHLRQWLNWMDKVTAVSDTRSFIRGALADAEDGVGFVFGIWHERGLVGAADVNISQDNIGENRTAAIGYWLDRDHQGRGIMTRCVKALVRYGFEELGLHRIEVRAATGNVRSRAIPERLGFKLDGVLREAEWVNDHFEDVAVYSVLKGEWEA